MPYSCFWKKELSAQQTHSVVKYTFLCKNKNPYSRNVMLSKSLMVSKLYVRRIKDGGKMPNICANVAWKNIWIFTSTLFVLQNKFSNIFEKVICCSCSMLGEMHPFFAWKNSWALLNVMACGRIFYCKVYDCYSACICTALLCIYIL